MLRSAPLLTRLARFAGEAAPSARVRVQISRDVPRAHGDRPLGGQYVRVQPPRPALSFCVIPTGAEGPRILGSSPELPRPLSGEADARP